MSKLVDQKALAQLAKALNDRAKGYAEAEASRAKGIEEGLQGRIKANEDNLAVVMGEATVEGSIKKALEDAKTHAETKDALLQQAIDTKVALETYNSKMTEIGNKDLAQDELIDDLDAAIKEINDRLGNDANLNLPAVDKAIKDFQESQTTIDETQDGRIEALENLFKGENSVDEKIEQAQADAEAKAAELDGALKTELEGKITAEVNRATGVESGFEARIADLETFENTHDHTAMEGRIGALEDANKQGGAVANAIAAAQTAAIDEAKRLDSALETKLQGNIDDKVAQSAYDVKVKALEDKDAELAQTIVDMKDVNKDGSLAKQIAAEVTRATAAEGVNAQAAADALKAAQDAQADINAFMNAADIKEGAVDTLKEIQEYINTHGEAAAKMVEDISDNAQAILTERGRAEGQEAAIRKELADAVGVKAAEGVEATGLRKEIADAVKVEADRAKGIEAGLAQAIADEATTARAAEEANANAIAAMKDKDVEGSLAARIQSLEGLVVGGEGEGIQAILSDVAKAKEDIKDLKEFKAANEGALNAANDAQAAAEDAQDAADAAQGDVDALEKYVKGDALDGKGGLEARIAANEAFAEGHSHEGLQSEIDAVEDRVEALETFKNGHSHQGITDNANAIAKLNGGVEEEGSVAKAIADALGVYATEAEILAVIGNVVNSLALTMENNKVVLKLGGITGVALTEVSLDVMNDTTDIDAIIAGLDA